MKSDEERLTVVNVVASTRVAEELDLPDIAIQLNCEYEPEQFPGVVYRVVDPKTRHPNVPLRPSGLYRWKEQG